MAHNVKLPPLYKKQMIFGYWDYWYPVAQVLIAPCGTKVGKSYGSGHWLGRRAMTRPGTYNVWIAPTYLKAKIGFRYLKYFIPNELGTFLEHSLEIKLINGSVIKFLHGKDAETTIEGEAIDSFVIDESGKIDKQVWYSLFTTISQTKGRGIITGTPRGHTWYYDEFRRAQAGDPFFVWTRLKTADNPYVDPKMVANAKRLLPKYLFDQYYNAEFVSVSSTFGDFSRMFDETIKVRTPCKFWIHPDEKTRAAETVTGWDIAQRRDWSVFTTTNLTGQLVGFARFQGSLFETQVARLKMYLEKYMKGERFLRYDATGIGNPVGEMIADADIDANTTAVTFTNKWKSEAVGRLTMAVEGGWFKAPRIEEMYAEFSTYEVNVTKSGLHSYGASSGSTDDIVSSLLLSVPAAHQLCAHEESDMLFQSAMAGTLTGVDENDEKDLEPELYRDPFFEGVDDFDLNLEE